MEEMVNLDLVWALVGVLKPRNSSPKKLKLHGRSHTEGFILFVWNVPLNGVDWAKVQGAR